MHVIGTGLFVLAVLGFIFGSAAIAAKLTHPGRRYQRPDDLRRADEAADDEPFDPRQARDAVFGVFDQATRK